jgi:phage/plasmid-associated DNA primase
LATSDYRVEQDAIKGFLDERLVFEKTGFVGATELYENYVSWCREEGREALSQGVFGQRMMVGGLVTRERKFKANRYHYVGVRLHTDADQATTGAQ